MRYAKEAGLENATSKWMAWRKTWTSEEVSHYSVNRRRCKYLRVVISVRGLEGSGKICHGLVQDVRCVSLEGLDATFREVVQI